MPLSIKSTITRSGGPYASRCCKAAQPFEDVSDAALPVADAEFMVAVFDEAPCHDLVRRAFDESVDEHGFRTRA